MIRYVTKAPKISLCRTCGGTGLARGGSDAGSAALARGGKVQACADCKGSGRVVVGCHMVVTIKPYKAVSVE